MSEHLLHAVLFICTAAVVIGVVLEGYEHWDDFKQKGWKPIVPKLGFAILVLGVAGELLVQPFIDSAESDFRLDASRRIEEAKRDQGRLKTQAAELTKAAEDERLARLKIEGKIARRALSEEQQRRIALKLAPLAPQVVGIFLVSPKIDDLGFAWEIKGALDIAGWTSDIDRVKNLFACPGLFAELKPSPSPSPDEVAAVNTLRDALAAEQVTLWTGGITSELFNKDMVLLKPALADAPIWIFVCEKGEM